MPVTRRTPPPSFFRSFRILQAAFRKVARNIKGGASYTDLFSRNRVARWIECRDLATKLVNDINILPRRYGLDSVYEGVIDCLIWYIRGYVLSHLFSKQGDRLIREWVKAYENFEILVSWTEWIFWKLGYMFSRLQFGPGVTLRSKLFGVFVEKIEGRLSGSPDKSPLSSTCLAARLYRASEEFINQDRDGVPVNLDVVRRLGIIYDNLNTMNDSYSYESWEVLYRNGMKKYYEKWIRDVKWGRAAALRERVRGEEERARRFCAWRTENRVCSVFKRILWETCSIHVKESDLHSFH